MRHVLDLHDYVTPLYEKEKDNNENFYRYYILDCNDERVATVWFSQREDNGNIYTVYVRLLSEEFEGFDIFVTDDVNKYYPQAYEILTPHKRLTSGNDAKEYIKNLQLVNLIANTVMDIFKEEEHIQKYTKGH